MPILTSDFTSLTDDLQEIFNEVARTKIAEMRGMNVFSVRDTDRRTYDHLVLHGLSGIKRVAQGADLPSVASVEGDSITYTQTRYGALVSITKDMRMFDLHDQIEGVVRSITEEAFDLIDQSMADILLYGWSTSYTDVYGQSVSATGPDGLALFNSAHTNNLTTRTFTNLIQNSSGTADPALAVNPVANAIRQAMVYTDPGGLVRPIHLDTLVVAPRNWDLAERIVQSDLLQGTGNNDINPLKGRIRKIIVWERLETRSDATDTSQYWFMFDSQKVGESLKALFAERPSLDPPEQVYKNKNWDYSLDYYYALGRGFPAYIWGSRGTA